MSSTRIFVVGGAKDFVIDGPVVDHFAKHDIEILGHLPGADGSRQKPPEQLPLGCDGVVIFRDMTGHGAYYAARDLADKQGIPCAAVPRKWAKAEPLLRMQGILKPKENSRKAPPQTQVVGVAAAYITEEREWGRTPALNEVRAAIKTAFGSNVSYTNAAHQQALAKVVSPPPTDLAPEHLMQAVTMVMDDDAELHLDPERLREAVGVFIDAIPATLPLQDITKAAKAVLTGWQQDCRNPRKQKARHAAGVSWLKKVWKGYLKDGDPYPVDQILRPRFQEVFGWHLNSAWNAEARMAVVGSWADKLIGLKAAQRRYEAGGGVMSFEALIEDGSIPCLQAGRKRLTGEGAVDAVLKQEVEAIKPKPTIRVPEVTPEVVVPTPDPVHALLQQLVTRLDRIEAQGVQVQMPDMTQLLEHGGMVTIHIQVNPKPKGT